MQTSFIIGVSQPAGAVLVEPMTDAEVLLDVKLSDSRLVDDSFSRRVELPAPIYASGNVKDDPPGPTLPPRQTHDNDGGTMNPLDNLLGTDAGTQLAIYLNDHRAGAEGAAALARRSARANADNIVGEYLGGQFMTELKDDRTLLEALRERFGVRPNPAKQCAARVAEFVGRAKLNGAISGPAPLSRVLELEALIAAVAGKRQLWRTATTLPGVETDLFAEQLARADDQLDRLEELHRWATSEAFDSRNSTQR